jgi:hypothetical protein
MCVAGESQSGQVLPALSHTVMTLSNGSEASVLRCFGTYFEMSMPTSAITFTASGWIYRAGVVPAERACHRPAISRLIKPSAIWLRAEFPVHRIMTCRAVIQISR